MRHLRAWSLGSVALFWLWLLLAGEWNAYEWVAAAGAAAAASALGERARSRAGIAARVPLRRLTDLGAALVIVFVDFGLLMWALGRSAVRRDVVHGRFVVRERALDGDDSAAVGARAWTAAVGTLSPNSYVVDIGRDDGLVLLHDLVPFRPSEKPV